MRIRLLFLVPALVVAALAAAAEESQSAPGIDKAQQIMDRVIEALGGPAYLNVRDMTRRGRLYSFDRGQLASPGDRFLDLVKFPGKEWLEIGKKGKIVYLNNGEEGWELDRQGIRDMAPEQIEAFHEGNQRDLEYLLRFRLHEERIQLYYLGREFVDNRQTHIVELVDSENESLKLYLDSNTYLPTQLRYKRRDSLTGERIEEIEYYGKYVKIQGIQTSMQLTRQRLGQRTFEAFFTKVTYNSGIPDSQFSRAALDERWRKVK